MNKIPIAKIGRVNGLKGWMKLHLLTDFPEQFKKGKTFESDKFTLTVEGFDERRRIVKFKEFDTPEEVRKLTNRVLYTNQEESKENCNLKEDEYFWFDIIGCKVIEDSKLLGIVDDITRINESDYLIINTYEILINEGFAKRFLLEFKIHKEKVDIKDKTIFVKNAFIILENS